MAGPGAGPSGGTIYIDGFTGGNLPPKSSIREIRINSNPFSPEYDRPGFGRIEILTKPGTDQIHGNVFVQYNNEDLNSRSPLFEQATRPPYKQDFFGFSLTGPIKKNKASFSFDGNYRGTTENAFILATDLNTSLVPQTINQAVLTPLTFHDPDAPPRLLHQRQQHAHRALSEHPHHLGRPGRGRLQPVVALLQHQQHGKHRAGHRDRGGEHPHGQ